MLERWTAGGRVRMYHSANGQTNLEIHTEGVGSRLCELDYYAVHDIHLWCGIKLKQSRYRYHIYAFPGKNGYGSPWFTNWKWLATFLGYVRIFWESYHRVEVIDSKTNKCLIDSL